MKKTLLSLVLTLAVFATAVPVLAAQQVEDPWLEMSFMAPSAQSGWKMVRPDKFKFSLIETEPAYVFQKGNAVIMVLYQQAEGLWLEEASEWMYSAASSAGETSEMRYIDINGRLASRFVVRGKGKAIGSIPELADKTAENMLITAINGGWLIRILYSSPDYKGNMAAVDSLLASLVFKGAEDPRDAELRGKYRVNSEIILPDSGGAQVPTAGGNSDCKSDAVLKIKAPADGYTTQNSETSLKALLSDIDELRMVVNGEELAILFEPENPLYKSLLLTPGKNTIELIGKDVCGRRLKDSVTVMYKEK